MFVEQIWGYPTKSMAGERIAATEVTALGIAGPGAELTHYTGPERFDILPLLVATCESARCFSTSPSCAAAA